MQELIVLVNEYDEQVGVMPKLPAHNSDTPLHRAFSCYVFNKEGKFLLTQRALKKKVFPGMWTNSCCGHPAPGEATEDAIRRRLKFELGLVPDEIKLILPNFRYRAVMDGIVENEISPAYIATVSTEPYPNPEEVEQYEWLSWDDFLHRIKKEPEKFSQWCRGQVRELKNKSLVKKYIEV